MMHFIPLYTNLHQSGMKLHLFGKEWNEIPLKMHSEEFTPDAQTFRLGKALRKLF